MWQSILAESVATLRKISLISVFAVCIFYTEEKIRSIFKVRMLMIFDDN